MTGKRHNPHFHKLLVGYDGSKESQRADDLAFSFAECIAASWIAAHAGAESCAAGPRAVIISLPTYVLENNGH